MTDHWKVIEDALTMQRTLLNMSAYWDEHRGQEAMKIDAALAFVREQQLAERSEWEPVPDGRIESQHDGSFVFVEGEWLQVTERILSGNTDMVDTAEADIALPDDIRLCRRVQREDDSNE